MQYIGKLDVNKLGKYKEKIITDEVILTDERLFHILINHKEEYEQLKTYIQSIVEEPDYIIEDNRHLDTMIYLKEIQELSKKSRVVIKLALGYDDEHSKNSIITLMRLNERTWEQTIKNRGKIVWRRLDKNE